LRFGTLFVVCLIFGILGSALLGLVAGLANIVTNEYVDYNLPNNPVIQEFDFRIAGRYGWISLFLLICGIVFAIGGNMIGIYTFFEYQAFKKASLSRDRGVPMKNSKRLFDECPKCGESVSPYYKFCPECGTSLKNNN
jgi:hypothetical protein